MKRLKKGKIKITEIPSQQSNKMFFLLVWKSCQKNQSWMTISLSNLLIKSVKSRYVWNSLKRHSTYNLFSSKRTNMVCSYMRTILTTHLPLLPPTILMHIPGKVFRQNLYWLKHLTGVETKLTRESHQPKFTFARRTQWKPKLFLNLFLLLCPCRNYFQHSTF